MPDLPRRSFMTGLGAAGLSACVPIDSSREGRTGAALAILDRSSPGTLGAFVLDTGTGFGAGVRADERFGHCSSFKASLAAMVLHLDTQGVIKADQVVRWSEDELMFVSPFTKRRLDTGATMLELAEATQKYSDNAAANVLLRDLGGPGALTSFWRELGDETSRLDRIEPELNEVPPGEVRDTTTPRAMATTIARLLYGGGLNEVSARTLKQWMRETETGSRRVRAGLPDDWLAGDKTGTSIWPGMGSLYVDIGFIEPPDRAPLTFATYYRAERTHDGIDRPSEAVLAQAGRIFARLAQG